MPPGGAQKEDDRNVVLFFVVGVDADINDKSGW